MKPVIHRKARHEYEILDTYEAGLVLFGHEVKSIKNGQIDLKGAYVTVKSVPTPELYLLNATVARYKKAGPLPDYDPTRSRKLLLHKKEINQLIGKLKTKGLTLIPLRVYTKGNKIKLEFGLGRGKKQWDKKEDKKKKDIDREIKRRMKQY
jgi:SsrA-binding protein